MIADGYGDAKTLAARIAAAEAWLAKPELLSADASAEYAAVIEIDLAQITEPILACPNDPDDVKKLSEVANTKIDDVFLGSCMTNIGHFRAAGEIWKGQKFTPPVRTWICPPTRMDQQQLKDEAYYSTYSASAPASRSPAARCAWATRRACRTERTCSRPRPATSTTAWATARRCSSGPPSSAPSRRTSAGCPTPAEYFAAYQEKIAPKAAQVYRYLQFDELEGYQGLRVVA